MAHSPKFSSPLPSRWSSSNSSGKLTENDTRSTRRSASSTQLRGSIGLSNTKNESQVAPPVSLIVTKPDGDEFASENESGTSRLVPRRLHTSPSSTIFRQQLRPSTSGQTARNFDQLTRRSTSDMSPKPRDTHPPSNLKAYYSPKTAPLFISQQTSASSSRDFALRKGHTDATETRELSPVSPSPSVASFQLPEEGLLSQSKFFKKRPPQLDLSLLFPKPQPSTGGLLSPEKLVHSPTQLSPVSETSSLKDALDDAWQKCRPLRKTLSRESVRSRDHPLEESQPSEPNPRKGCTKWDLQNIQHLLKRKLPTDVRSETTEGDFVQRLAQNIQEQCPKLPRPDYDNKHFRYQTQNTGGTRGKPVQQRAVSAPGPASRQAKLVQHSISSRPSQKTTRKNAPGKESARQRIMSPPISACRNSDSVRPCSSSGSGRRTVTSKKSGGSVFSRSDLQEQSVLELSSSGDEGEVFSDCLDVGDEDFIFQGKLEKSQWRSAGSSSSRSSYFTAKAEQMSKGSQKSNLMNTPRTMRHCVSFLRAEEPQDNMGGGRRSAPASNGLRSWLTEITPPTSPESSNHSGSVLTMAVSQEERDLLQAMREKRAMLLGRLRTDIPPESFDGGLLSPNPILSSESSIWLPLECNSSPRRTGQRLSETRSSPGLRNEYFVDRYPTPLAPPPESSRRIRRTPSFVCTNSLPSPPSSEPSPITPPMYQAMTDQMVNYLLSASTSPSSTLYDRNHLSKPGTKNGTFLEPGTPATPLLDRNGRERIINRLISASTSSSSTRGDRGRYLGGRTASFDRLISDDEDSHASEGFAFSELRGRVASAVR
ncbi:hypothetical protein FGG08_001523 [Glutinoglossum americanum]|uniref:Uncharacterized protein n=1 Tax=Glutinoglossum americanum TaxID=1670608 RepID=A0A9P8I875_9PEZI|nr:hypothetical protein FGG08_001523 [Glutinoglossum americanum]